MLRLVSVRWINGEKDKQGGRSMWIKMKQKGKLHMYSLVSVGHICDLQGLFSEIDNMRTVNRIEL